MTTLCTLLISWPAAAPVAPEVVTAAPAAAEPGLQETLLAQYEFGGVAPDWEKVVYYPRQFTAGVVIRDATWGDQVVNDPGPYSSWDLFPTPNDGFLRTSDEPDWVTLRLTRPATLAIVWNWDEGPPSWLSSQQGWTPAANVVIEGGATPTYTKRFEAGDVVLGGVNEPGTPRTPQTARDTYWVLLGEATGSPSPEPPVPVGRDVPRPNRPCPAWVHEQYVTTGPDGRTYPTWHPQIDPVYWCYFGHEHGSDPALFLPDYRPAYGYTSVAAGIDEAHPGFKSYVFDDTQGHRWLLTHHFGTGSIARACARFHGVDLAVVDTAFSVAQLSRATSRSPATTSLRGTATPTGGQANSGLRRPATPATGRGTATYQGTATPVVGQAAATYQGTATPVVGQAAATYQGTATPATGHAGRSFRGSATPATDRATGSYQGTATPATGHAAARYRARATPAVGQASSSFRGPATPATGRSTATYQGTATPVKGKPALTTSTSSNNGLNDSGDSTLGLLADLHILTDFGMSVVNDLTEEPLRPPSCPNQAAEADADGSYGVRKLPVETRGAIGYEPWRTDFSGNTFGLTGAFDIVTPDPIVYCADMTCSQPVVTDASGSFRWFGYTYDLSLVAPAAAGVFYTDARGQMQMTAGQPGAVRQYIKPGLSIAAGYLGDSAACFTQDAWHAFYDCGPPPLFGNPTSREGSIGGAN